MKYVVTQEDIDSLKVGDTGIFDSGYDDCAGEPCSHYNGRRYAITVVHDVPSPGMDDDCLPIYEVIFPDNGETVYAWPEELGAE